MRLQALCEGQSEDGSAQGHVACFPKFPWVCKESKREFDKIADLTLWLFRHMRFFDQNSAFSIQPGDFCLIGFDGRVLSAGAAARQLLAPNQRHTTLKVRKQRPGLAAVRPTG